MCRPARPPLLGIALALLGLANWDAAAQPPTGAGSPMVVLDFDRPFQFSFGSWQRQAAVRSGSAHLRGCDSRGGAGYDVDLNLRDRAADSPVLLLRTGPANSIRTLQLRLRDAENRTATWHFELPANAPQNLFLPIPPRDGASLEASHAHEGNQPLDLATIRQLQIQGDWVAPGQFDIEVDAVLLTPPTPALLAQRAARRQAEARAAEARQASRVAARARIQHTPQSPWVEHLSAAGPRLLALTIRAGRVEAPEAAPYTPQPGDELVYSPARALAWKEGRLGEQPADRTLMRLVAGERVAAGWIFDGPHGDPWWLPAERIAGSMLELGTADDPESYRIGSPDDARAQRPLTPLAVHRKSKPCNQALPGQGAVYRHRLYLELPFPLEEDRTYTVELPGVNARETTATYRHRPREVRCEALHVSHVGYRPDDPFKRGLLSLWTGSGGHCGFPGLTTFELLDETGRTVHRGRVAPISQTGTGQSAAQPAPPSGYVAALDFSAFNSPGRYRLYVPGLGCSDSFPLADDTWLAAFQTSMRGFLHHRSGIELGPPLTPYRRPRNLHPDDGLQVYASTTSLPEAEAEPGNRHTRLAAGHTDRLLPRAWGGYADSADLSRRYVHLWATYLHLELAECFPEFFRGVRLTLPPAEATNNLPDLLDEALWNIDAFRRLQQPDGGVPGGVELAAPPRAGEPSWRTSLAVFAYAPDPAASYLYAACGARAARLVEPLDARQGRTLRQSAGLAWLWADQHRTQFQERFGEGYRAELRHTRATAAVELYRLMGETALHQAFLQDTVLVDPNPAPVIEQQGAVFAYARLPEDLGVPEWKAKARQALVDTAEAALRFAANHAYGLTTELPDLPEIGAVGYFTVPGMLSRSLPRAHYLSGETRYLAGTVRSCNFSAGANPDNMTFTTGVGHRWPEAPLHPDSRLSRQPPPAGLTVHGASHPARGDDAFAWAPWGIAKLTTPEYRRWPAEEAYVDFYLWPSMNEASLHQTLGPTSYTWGYLAARGRTAPLAVTPAPVR